MNSLGYILAIALIATPIAGGASLRDDANREAEQVPAAAALAVDAGYERWELTLPKAIFIALDNCDDACVLFARMPDATITALDPRAPTVFLDYHQYYDGPIGCWDNPPRKARIAGPLLIQRVKSDTPLWRFRADAMALVRSVEQQYWVVAAQRVRVACAEHFVKTANAVVDLEEKDSHNRVSADFVELRKKRDQFQKELRTARAKLTDGDRRLHVILGLPPADGRRLVTVTRPIDQPSPCELRECSAEMARTRGDLVERMVVKANCEATSDPLAVPSSIKVEPSAIRAKSTQQEAKETNEWVESVERQTRSLAGACSAVAERYRRYQRAKQLRNESAQRLKSRKARYDEGRITAEPYLDAVSQNAEAVVAEAECVCGYNASIAALGEAKGTLLGDRFILVIDQPLRIPKNWVDGPDEPVERPTAGARPRYKIAGEQNDMPELDLTPKR